MTQIHEFIQVHPERCFLNLAERIANARREADVDSSKQILALTQKLTGNSLYSATLLNEEKHRDLTYHTDQAISKAINQPNFASLNPISTALYEVQSLKKKISHNLPIYVGVGGFLNANMRMLEFYYDFLLKFVPKDQFELIELDTDSFYMALASDSLENFVPDHLKREFFSEAHEWLPSECCPDHREEYITTRCAGRVWVKPPCCIKRARYDLRTPGLFKLEYFGDSCYYKNFWFLV